MANSLYDTARAAFAQAQINWVTDNISVVLVDTAQYTYSATHQFLSSIPAGARTATTSVLSRTVTANGACDAADTVFSAVSGASVEAIVLYKDTGTAATSQLIAYFDTLTGLPFTPIGLSVTLTWANDTNAIFRL